jgi:hypothetical protein
MKKKMKVVKSSEMDDCCEPNDNCCNKKKYGCGGCGGVYGVGFIGAAVYYISTASGFWVGVFGLLKAAV